MKHYFVIVCLLNLVKCERVGFIVGGKIANIRQFPHSGFLRVICGNKKQSFVCGTSIVNQMIMLTAAHCLNVCTVQEKKKGNTMTVFVGHIHSDKGIVRRVNKSYTHEEYHSVSLNADIGLLKLNKNLVFSHDVRRVALMKRPPYYETAQVAGWGALKEVPKEKTKILHYTNQHVLTKKKCRKVCKYRCDITDGTFCAIGSSYASDGDSGSALIVRGYIQIGLVSHKKPDVSTSLVFYTDTGYFYDWIRKTSKKLYCYPDKLPGRH